MIIGRAELLGEELRHALSDSIATVIATAPTRFTRQRMTALYSTL
ncbi:MAG TPA: hypothetical protein VFK22_01885 [Candidatus Dormibacteraeota bacterium]|nr:hypothetical protein [Candidatus Dormibacteraeota bacterium]